METDFLMLRERGEVTDLAQRAVANRFSDPIEARRERIIVHLLRGSFEADFFSFHDFNANQPSAGALNLAKALGRRLDQLVSEGLL
jgi:hypothetical protein